MATISREAYAEMFGPTTGDRVRLGDTSLWIEVEDDKTTYGEEVKFGGGKVIRDGMGQCQSESADVVDTVITNAPDGRWHRCSYPFYLSSANRRSTLLRCDDYVGRRYRSGYRD